MLVSLEDALSWNGWGVREFIHLTAPTSWLKWTMTIWNIDFHLALHFIIVNNAKKKFICIIPIPKIFAASKNCNFIKILYVTSLTSGSFISLYCRNSEHCIFCIYLQRKQQSKTLPQAKRHKLSLLKLI